MNVLLAIATFPLRRALYYSRPRARYSSCQAAIHFSGPGAATTSAHEAVSLSSPGRPVTSGPPRDRSASGSAAA